MEEIINFEDSEETWCILSIRLSSKSIKMRILLQKSLLKFVKAAKYS